MNILSNVLEHFIGLAFIFPAIILHEVAHGYVAFVLGDPTAKRAGRLTLNPIKHVDPWGTLLMPLLLLVLSGGSFAFGYAKPVPINTMYFKNERVGTMLTGVAGPLTNIALASIVGLMVRLGVLGNGYGGELAVMFAYLNLMLAFFNLIPIPPLDGSRVLQLFLPDSIRRMYDQMERYGFLIIFGVLYFLPRLLDTYLSVTAEPLLRLMFGA